MVVLSEGIRKVWSLLPNPIQTVSFHILLLYFSLFPLETKNTTTITFQEAQKTYKEDLFIGYLLVLFIREMCGTLWQYTAISSVLQYEKPILADVCLL